MPQSSYIYVITAWYNFPYSPCFRAMLECSVGNFKIILYKVSIRLRVGSPLGVKSSVLSVSSRHTYVPIHRCVNQSMLVAAPVWADTIWKSSSRAVPSVYDQVRVGADPCLWHHAQQAPWHGHVFWCICVVAVGVLQTPRHFPTEHRHACISCVIGKCLYRNCMNF